MRTGHKFIETLATSERYVIINSGIKEAAVPNIPYRKINCWKNELLSVSARWLFQSNRLNMNL